MIEKLLNRLKFYGTIVYLIFLRDLRFLTLLFKFFIKIRWYSLTNQTILPLFENNVRKNGDKTAVIYQNKSYSFEDLNDLSLKISNWLESTLEIFCDDEYELRQQQKLQKEQEENKNSEDVINLIKQHQNTMRIGLMFSNIPEMGSFMIGCARVRCSTVLFNYNHRNEMLLNAFEAANCKVFIFESKFLDAIKEIANRLPSDIQLFIYDRNMIDIRNNRSNDDDTNLQQLNYKGFTSDALLNNNITDNDRNFAKILYSYPLTNVRKNYTYKMTDIFTYIFTSGTTGGKIKAAAMSNYKCIGSDLMMSIMFGVNSNDNLYICVPLYHGLGGIIGLLSAMIINHTITLTEKFSASKFWKDCYENRCITVMYIGELCRILLSRPKDTYERMHSVQKFIGVGMNRTIWKKFVERFNIKNVYEFYGSSEGNAASVNLLQVPGSCGFLPYYFAWLYQPFYPLYFLKVDIDTQEFIRDPKTGLCVEAKPGETGMIVCVIRKNLKFTHYVGYSSMDDSSKKLVRNIASKNDYGFISGDLMEMDEYGNLYFKDRTGDTFRWKGENVSTTEIESIISQFINHKDCIVYGVQIPGYEGRCGMAAIAMNNTDDSNDYNNNNTANNVDERKNNQKNPIENEINLKELYEYMKKQTPEYSIPKFIRFVNEIKQTTTFKYIKYQLRNEGIDPKFLKTNEKIYYFNYDEKNYQQMNGDIYDKIINGKIRF